MKGNVIGLYRYPVKSMAGETLETMEVGAGGVPGDRGWAVRDEERGGIRGGKRFAELMACSAAYESEPAIGNVPPARVTLPSGDSFMSNDPQLPGTLGELVGSPLSIWPLLPEDALDHYRRGAPVLEDMEAELRQIFARSSDEPLPDLSVFPAEKLEYASPPGTYFDAYPILVMTTQSLSHMQKCDPDREFDTRRFRPNILLDCPDEEGLIEAGWEGLRLKIGTVELKLEIKCLRCVMATHGFDNLPQDPKVMRALVKHADGCLGIYASVNVSGLIHLGDQVELC